MATRSELGPDDLARRVRAIPDFPKPGILFRDIMPLVADPEAFAASIRLLAAATTRPGAVVAIESRGFLFGAGLALHWSVPLVTARKFGKLPGATLRQRYALEYGEDGLELQVGAIPPGGACVIVDDLLATGGTARAAADLVAQAEGRVDSLLFVIELEGLGGRARLQQPVHALMRMPAG